MFALMLDHPGWVALQQYLAKHVEIEVAAAEGLIIAFVITMPALFPKTFQDWWTWLRNGLQTAVPAARNHNLQTTTETVVAPPVASTTTTVVAESEPKEGQ